MKIDGPKINDPKPATETRVSNPAPAQSVTLPAGTTQTNIVTQPAACGRTAPALLDYLSESGTPEEILAEPREWLRQNPGLSAEAMYAHLEATSVTHGTLRKAIKWAFDDVTREPEQHDASAPADVLKALQEELATTKKALAETQREKMIFARQRDLAIERNNELARKVKALEGGRTSSELAAMGVE